MTTAAPTWPDLFRDNRHALLGQLARARRNPSVRCLADEETVLVGGASESARLSSRPRPGASPRAVMLTPEGPGSTLEEFRATLQTTRQTYPDVEVAGFGPHSEPVSARLAGLDRGVVMAGRADSSFEPHRELAELQGLAAPLTAVLVYTPDVTPEALESAVQALLQIPNVVSVVPLPAGAGDRIPLPGLTTAGNVDAMVISVLRLLLPSEVRVRASWAALGWKVAQVALAYGADELAGWTAAESLAYTGRVRAASRVERQELLEGLEEARCTDAGWYGKV